ncbi:hypothetical protein [Rubrivivax gelatinosus]|uniref:Uncharacterized protein n=1 Tax=Rubrivivax gelatinosus TaxID=28068 RepID=A0ABS1DZ56_RUBGE|nr:hypothetical protein [Rubrivivax gelatinosus]MBK1714000.1 hypothetical protein [Rubrivivax gelatinosus]
MSRNRLHHALACAALAAAAAPALALDLSWSGFGTLGWAQSSRGWVYERSVDDGGSVDRDSVLGLQLDASLAPKWSATLQLKAAQSLEKDSRWDLTPTWAFLAWRPDDDWLLRAGRMRVPLYLHSEILDVGATHDLARLPTEMYSIVPSNEFDGVSTTRTWSLGADELSLDAYAGRMSTTARFWSRDGLPGFVEPGAVFVDIDTHMQGVVLALRQPGGLWRAGLHRVRTSQTDGKKVPVTLPYVSLGEGLPGFYKVDDSVPYGPDVRTVSTITNWVFTLGLEQRLGGHWRVAAEYARDLQRDTELGSNTSGGYVALFREFGAVTPYLSLARLRSTKGTRDWYRKLTAHPLPATVPGAAQLNAAQRLMAEGIWAADQRSVALGASWALDARSKLKFEWKRTHVGDLSRLIETPPGSDTIHDTHLDLWSLNYSFSF